MSEYTVQAFANYDRTFNVVHTVSATAGIEANKYMYDNATLGRKEYLLDVDQIRGLLLRLQTPLLRGHVHVPV